MALGILLIIGAALPALFWARMYKKRSKYLNSLNSILLEEHPMQCKVGDHCTLTDDESIYWYFHKLSSSIDKPGEREEKHRLQLSLLRRIYPGDVVQLARSPIRDKIPLKETSYDRLVAALKELADAGEWRHLSYIMPPLANRVFYWGRDAGMNPDVYYIEQIFIKTTNYQLAHRDRLYCEEHLRRFDLERVKRYTYGVCRSCRGSQYGIIVKSSFLMLDRSVSWKKLKKETTFWINGFQLEELCDFDALIVGVCSYEDIERFCIMIGNDSDKKRAKLYRRIEYRLRAGNTITEKGLALLDRFFERGSEKLLR
ncbi:MAG: hypothetical protein KTR29_10800 [Rhodothermaceae bacterium]|nr:hypothetical protein [Rhodothermaceae bacterium]